MKRLIPLLLALLWALPMIAHAQLPTEAQPRTIERTQGRALNPDIGVNILGTAQRSNRAAVSTGLPRGLSFQEIELQLSADVDPYFRAGALFSLHNDEAPNADDYVFEPEEVFVETMMLPFVQLRAGKFKAALGRHNLLHHHAYPFIDAPIIHREILGDEGLNDVGASASLLLPAPWFTELTLQAFRTGPEGAFASADRERFAGVAHLKSLWETSDETTLEVGLSGARGPNAAELTTGVLGADVTFKWRPSDSARHRALMWSTEYLGALRAGDAAGERLGGLASWLQFQFAQRWWAQLRTEWTGLPESTGYEAKDRQSTLLGFFPTEFSSLRLQYSLLRDETAPREHALAFQWNMSIGAHPAHAY